MNSLKILLLVLSLLFMLLQYTFWLGKGGYQEYNTLQRMVEKQRQENTILKIRNDVLQAEVADLKRGGQAIEERARMELGMIKQNEVFYQIVE